MAKTRSRAIKYLLVVCCLLLLAYVASFAVLVFRGRNPGWPGEWGFQYAESRETDRALGVFYSPVYFLASMEFNILHLHPPMRSITDVLAKQRLDSADLLSIEYSDVPFVDVLHKMPGVLPEALRGKVSGELAVQGRYGETLFTLMLFRITRAELEELADALGMRRTTEGESRAVENWVRYDFARQSQSAPAWFMKWSTTKPLVAGSAHGMTYEFSFLGTPENDGEMVIFAEVLSWPESAGDASGVPSQIAWRDH